MMKSKIYMLILATISAWSFQSCDNDNNDSIPVSKELQAAFSAKYPNVKNVEWETKSGHYVADFHNEYDASAWFTADGIWKITETDIPYSALPESVKATFGASEYNKTPWRQDDVDKLECHDMETVYVIEVENPTQELDLYYSEDGILIKAVVDVDNNNDGSDYLPPTQLNAAMKSFIENKYPSARIVEFDMEDDRNEPDFGFVEIDIIHERISKEVLFDKNAAWYSTSWEIAIATLPEAIKNKISTNYSNYFIDDADFYEKPNDVTYYQLELEAKGQQEDITVKIAADGNVIKL